MSRSRLCTFKCLLLLLLFATFAFSNDVYELDIQIFYPQEKICEGCVLLISYSEGITQNSSGQPEQVPFNAIDGILGKNNDSYIPKQDTNNPSLYNMNLYYTPNNVGQNVKIVLFYSGLSATENGTAFIEENCPIVSFSGVGSSLGPDIFVQLQPIHTSATFYPYFCTTSGIVKEFDDGLNVTNTYQTTSSWIYLPPSILENPTPRFLNTLLIIADAQFVTSLPRILEGLILSGTISETSIVGITNIDQDIFRVNFLTPTVCDSVCFPLPQGLNCSDFVFGTGEGLTHLDLIYNVTLPRISNLFGIQTNREHTALSGFSLAGLLSCAGGYDKSYISSKLHCASPSLFWNCDEFAKTTLKAKASNPLSFFLTVGNKEAGLLSSFEETVARLQFLGYKDQEDLFVNTIEGFVHDITSYIDSLVWALPKIFPILLKS